MGAVRAFFAVLPPDEVREGVAAAVGRLRDAAGADAWRWTHPHMLHLTLAFLGELPAPREDDLIDAAQAWAWRQHPLAMRWANAGAFPDPATARVMWVGVADAAARTRCAQWARELRAAGAHVGARPDGGRFRPHVTVARARRPVRAGRWVQALDAYGSDPFVVERVVLIASHLNAGVDARYEVRCTFRLGGGSATD